MATPNLFRNSVTIEDLRQHARFIALPPVEHVRVLSPPTFRYVRQDSPEWDLLHAGTLTGSTVLGATGLCVPACAALIPRWPGYIAPKSRLSAFRRLSGAPDPRLYATRAEAAAAVAHNDATMRAYNAAKPALADVHESADAAAGGEAAHGMDTGDAAVASQAEGAGGALTDSESRVAAAQPASVSVLVDGVQRTLLLRPRVPVSVPEAADAGTSAAVDAAAGASAYESAYWLAPLATPQLVRPLNSATDAARDSSDECSDGGDSGAALRTPALQLGRVFGASARSGAASSTGAAVTAATVAGPQDERIVVYSIRMVQPVPGTLAALPVDPVVITAAGAASAPCSAQVPLSEWLPPQMRARALGTGGVRSRDGPALALPPPLPALPPAPFLAHLAAAALAPAQARVACASIARGRSEVRTIWGSVQEGAALLEVLTVFPLCTLHEVGLCMLDPRRWGYAPDALPPIGSSPDCLIYHPPCARCDAAKCAGAAQHAAGKKGRCEYCGDGLALPGRWEVVEVKNHCPFIKGENSRRWYVHNARPRARVPAQYVPQLQLQMLAAALPSALFVSRSSEHGTNVFRMYRDDAYCALLLRVVARFYERFVASKKVPPPAWCEQWPEWRQLAVATGKLSAGAELLKHLGADESPLGQSQPLFL